MPCLFCDDFKFDARCTCISHCGWVGCKVHPSPGIAVDIEMPLDPEWSKRLGLTGSA